MLNINLHDNKDGTDIYSDLYYVNNLFFVNIKYNLIHHDD